MTLRESIRYAHCLCGLVFGLIEAHDGTAAGAVVWAVFMLCAALWRAEGRPADGS